jgi:lipoyl(octanoyl) transferase
VRFLDHVPEQGEAFYAEVSRLRLEGLIAKRADAPYRAGRSPHWLKLRTERVDDFVVVGFTPPQGARTGFGALHLAAFDGEALVYCGRAGSGFGEEQLVTLREALDAERRESPACGGPLPTDRGHVWVEPRLVAEVRYLTWTEEGLLRQPVFLRLRDDKRPDECPMPVGRRGGGEAPVDSASVIPWSPVSPGDEESAGAETADSSGPVQPAALGMTSSPAGSPAARPLVVRRLGRISYARGLELQEALVAERQAGRALDHLLLLEHDPVFTLGRNARQENVLFPAEALRERGFDVFETGRGGDVTYHGPGQVVGYPIIDLSPDRRDVHRYVRDLEEVMMRTCADYGVEAGRVEGLTGAWVGRDKIGAIGVRIARWVTSHGFAFNVATDLSAFDLIVPCGIRGRGVTSLERLLGRPVPIDEVMDRLTRHFAAVFGATTTQPVPTE